MALFTGKTPKKAQHPVLDGLSDRALNAVYRAGEVQNFATETPVFTTGQASDSFLFILKGQGLCALESDPVNGVPVATSDTVSPGQFSRMGTYHSTLTSACPMQILVLKEALIPALEPDIQAHLYRNLYALSTSMLNRSERRHTTLNSQQHQYFDKLTQALKTKFDHYDNSDAVKSLIKKVPRLPPYASKLTSMMMNNEISSKEVAAIARLDPSLTASVLKTVNSSYYGLKHKILDFHHAFVLLGFNQIYQIVMNKGIQSTMPKTRDFKQLQFHCVMISVLSHEISVSLKVGNPALLSTVGLLHDIGKSVVLLMKHKQPQQAFLINLLDPDTIGSMLLREWKIPDEVCGCLEYLSLSELAPPEVIPPQHRIHLTILNLAHNCYEYLQAPENTTANTHFSAEQFRELNCRSQSVEDFVLNKLAPAIASRGNKLPKMVQALFDRKQQLPTGAELSEPAVPVNSSAAA